MICCYQVFKVFCTTYCIASALPVRSPCNLGSSADFTTSVFWEVSINIVLITLGDRAIDFSMPECRPRFCFCFWFIVGLRDRFLVA